MRAVGRLFAAGVGFLLALVAAAAFLLAAKVGLEPMTPEESALFWAQFLVYGGVTASLLGSLAFLPWTLLVLVTEIFSIRSFVVHVGAGGVLGLMGTVRLDRMQERLAENDAAFAADATLVVAAGFVAGFVYWLVAGRMAGLKPLGPPPATDHG